MKSQIARAGSVTTLDSSPQPFRLLPVVKQHKGPKRNVSTNNTAKTRYWFIMTENRKVKGISCFVLCLCSLLGKRISMVGSIHSVPIIKSVNTLYWHHCKEKPAINDLNTKNKTIALMKNLDATNQLCHCICNRNNKVKCIYSMLELTRFQFFLLGKKCKSQQ